jgi:hypothetical protein
VLNKSEIYFRFFKVATLCLDDSFAHSFVCVLALASLGYEKTCVLFNGAALASQIASEQNLDSDEGLKAAAKYYQVLL